MHLATKDSMFSSGPWISTTTLSGRFCTNPVSPWATARR